MKKLALTLLILTACGPDPERVDPVYRQTCYDAGSTLNADGVCIWPIFGVLPTSINPTPGPCSGMRRAAWRDCTICHTMGAQSGWHRWPTPTGILSNALALRDTGGCVHCHMAAP